MVHKAAVSPNLTLTDTLRISFQVLDKETGAGVQPHQTFLRFFDPLTNEEGIQPLRVSASGKTKFDLVRASVNDTGISTNPLQSMAKPPLSLPPTSGAPLKVFLFIGSPNYSPLKAELFDLYVPASGYPAPHLEEASYHPLPVIEHTFRAEQKLPPSAISAAFALAVFSPWIVLLGLVSMFTYAPTLSY